MKKDSKGINIMIAKTPEPPYYTVIFTSTLVEAVDGYFEMNAKMKELVTKQDGFIGLDGLRAEIGITVSYWKDLESIKKWKANAEHIAAQNMGKSKWYNTFKIRIAKVEIDYDFERE